MTDKEIIKALECCTAEGFVCSGCPYETLETQGVEYTEYDCSWYLRVDALDLIKRQQVVIEHLTMDNRVLKEKRINMFERLEVVSKTRAEAIREFAEKLQEKVSLFSAIGTQEFADGVAEALEWYDKKVEETLNEMAGGRAK